MTEEGIGERSTEREREGKGKGELGGGNAWGRCCLPLLKRDHRPWVAVPSTSNQTSSGILNRLQPAHQFNIRDAEEQRITVGTLVSGDIKFMQICAGQGFSKSNDSGVARQRTCRGRMLKCILLCA